MVHPQEDKNREIMQDRGLPLREAAGTGAQPPRPNEVVGHHGPPYEVVGIDALSPLLLHVQFPATKEEIVDAIGAARIPVDAQRTRTVREVLDRTAPVTFLSSAEVEAAVARAWDSIAPPADRGGHHRQDDNLSGRPRS